MCSELYSHRHNFGTFSSPHKETLYPLVITPFLPNPPLWNPSATTKPLSDSIDFPLLDSSYKWNHTIWGLLYLAYFTQYNVFRVHPCHSMDQYSIPFHCWIIVHLHFVYPFINWQALGWFYFLAIMNHAAVNFIVPVFVWTYVFTSLGCVPRSRIAESRVTLCLPFGLHSKVAAPFHYWVSPFFWIPKDKKNQLELFGYHTGMICIN